MAWLVDCLLLALVPELCPDDGDIAYQNIERQNVERTSVDGLHRWPYCYKFLVLNIGRRRDFYGA